VYIGVFGQSGFRTINDLSPDTITQFLHSIKPISIRWETAFAFRSWQNLSSGKLIPVEYAILTRVVTKAEISRFRKEYDDQSQPFEPIPMDAYASIISHCIRMVEDYSQDVIWLYDTYYASIVGGYEYSDRAALKPGSLSTTSREGVKAFLEYQPVSHEGKPWWPLHVVKNTSEYGIKYKYGYIFYTGLTSVLASVFDACCVIILATTGMRRSEVMWLHSECVSKDAEGYWLRYEVFKTSNASQGDIKKIPIPDVTAKAVALLERLGREARTYGGTDRLFVNSNMGHFGKSMHSGYPARACKRVSEAVGVDEGVHPHRFRKTLAMYLVYQDPKNIEIVRQLFSHVSLKMTLRYVLSLPGLNDEMRRIIARQNVDVLIEVLDGALSGRIGGNAGNRLRQSVENSPQFVARLQDKGKETLVQYVESMLDQGIKLLHRTNLAICMKTPGHFEAAPCDAKNDDPATKLHPNLFACDPFNCRFSAFVESNIPALQAEVIFHNKLVGHIYTGVKQKNFSERRIQEVVKRLAELGEAETETFLKQVANG
jgi:integrase